MPMMDIGGAIGGGGVEHGVMIIFNVYRAVWCSGVCLTAEDCLVREHHQEVDVPGSQD